MVPGSNKKMCWVMMMSQFMIASHEFRTSHDRHESFVMTPVMTYDIFSIRVRVSEERIDHKSR